MTCGECKFWVQAGERYKSFGEAYYSSKLGKCHNPIVTDLVFSVSDHELQPLTHSNEFDESFGCIYQESNTN